MVSGPSSFDFGYLHWYCYRFLEGRIPFCKFGLDIGSVACGITGLSMRWAGRSAWPRSLQPVLQPGSHHPLDDARKHALSFCALLTHLGYDPVSLAFDIPL